MKNIREVLKSVPRVNHSRSEYFNFLSFNAVLVSMRDEEIMPEDTILCPFYICEGTIYEIYDYNLNVRTVGAKNPEAYFLRKTGRSDLAGINRRVLEKLQACYIELENENFAVSRLLEYMDFVLESDELKERIQGVYNSFDAEKLVFELF